MTARLVLRFGQQTPGSSKVEDETFDNGRRATGGCLWAYPSLVELEVDAQLELVRRDTGPAPGETVGVAPLLGCSNTLGEQAWRVGAWDNSLPRVCVVQ